LKRGRSTIFRLSKTRKANGGSDSSCRSRRCRSTLTGRCRLSGDLDCRANNGDIACPAYRKLKHERIHVRRMATSLVGPVEGGFNRATSICPACGEMTNSKGADIYRLAGLSAEAAARDNGARLVDSQMDERQDSASPANSTAKCSGSAITARTPRSSGHFNDFVFVSLLRAAVYSALRHAGPTRSMTVRSAKRSSRARFRKEEPTSYAEWLADENMHGPLLLDPSGRFATFWPIVSGSTSSAAGG